MIDGEAATRSDGWLERLSASTHCDENAGRAAFQRRTGPIEKEPRRVTLAKDESTVDPELDRVPGDETDTITISS